MVAYSFKKQFVEPIRSGRKRQTIRAERNRHARPGETIQLYTAMRTRQCQKIGEAVCDRVVQVTIDFEQDEISFFGVLRMIFRADLEAFARCDGFDSWDAMVAFWKAEHSKDGTPLLKWSGVIILWRDFR